MVWSHKCWNNKGSIPHHEILYFIFNFKNKSILSKWSILWKIHKIKVYRLMNCHKKNRSCNQQSQEMKHHQHIRNTLWTSPTLSLYPTSPQVTTILLSNINNYFCLFLNFICKKSYHLDHFGLSLSFRFLMWDSFMLLHVACYAFYWGLFRLCSGLGIMNHSVKSLVLKKNVLAHYCLLYSLKRKSWIMAYAQVQILSNSFPKLSYQFILSSAFQLTSVLLTIYSCHLKNFIILICIFLVTMLSNFSHIYSAIWKSFLVNCLCKVFPPLY